MKQIFSRSKRWLVIGSALGALFISTCAASCSGSTHQSSQAGPTDQSSAQVLQMPAGYRNVAVKCVVLRGAGFAVASVSDGGNGDNLSGSISIVPAPHCTSDGP